MEKLYNLVNQARSTLEYSKIAKIPFPLFLGSNDSYQVIEYIKNPTLIDHRLYNQIEPNDTRRIEIEKRLNQTHKFWENLFFRHNDFHSRNVLIDPSSNDLTVIDFDLSQFCEGKEQFTAPYQMQIGNKIITASNDRDIDY